MRNRRHLRSIVGAPAIGSTARKETAPARTRILTAVALVAAGAGVLGSGFLGMGLLQAHAAEPAAITQGGITLKSVSVTFPDSQTTLPGGDAAQVVLQNCTACHSPGMIMTQPVLSEGTWREEVSKMINVYKAPVSAEDVPAIVGYLVAHKGTK